MLNKKDYYQLYENGEKFEKPNYYLNGNSLEKIKGKEGKIIFLSDKNKFLFDPKKHKSSSTSKLKPSKNIKIVEAPMLHKLEGNEFSKSAKKIKTEKGFKPIPPLKHHLLKIIIVIKNMEKYDLYEVDWII